MLTCDSEATYIEMKEVLIAPTWHSKFVLLEIYTLIHVIRLSVYEKGESKPPRRF